MHVPRAVVCLPTYNERENLEAMVRALGEVLDTSRDGVLVIDDGSPDGTGEIADRLAEELSWVSVLHREQKQGIGPAYIAGFRHLLASDTELVLEMDCDFSHDPGDVPRLIAAASEARPGARVALRRGRRDGELGAHPTRYLPWRLHLRAGSPRRARAGPDRRLQVLPPGDPGGDRPGRALRARLCVPDRDDVPRAAEGDCGCRRSRSASSSAVPERRR